MTTAVFFDISAPVPCQRIMTAHQTARIYVRIPVREDAVSGPDVVVDFVRRNCFSLYTETGRYRSCEDESLFCLQSAGTKRVMGRPLAVEADPANDAKPWLFSNY